MSSEAFPSLVNNAALLLALAVLYVTIPRRQLARPYLVRVLTGLVLGAIGIAVMLTPWRFSPGVVFDTRSILLAISGLFFGAIPTIMAALFTALLRLYQGGAGAWTGVGVIATSAVLGLAWGAWRRRSQRTFGWGELYLFGVVVHVAMLLWMLTLPAPTAGNVLRNISLPVMAIYPLGTVLLGKLLAYQQARMAMEEQTRASEQRFRKMVDQGWDVISLHKADGRLLYASESINWMLGRAADESRGMQPADWIHPDDLPLVGEVLRTLHPGLSRTIELRARHQDGRWVWLETTLTNRLDDPDVAAMVANSRNISNRKRAEQELRRITETTPVGIAVLNRDGQITFANPFAEQVLGLTISEITQRRYDAPDWQITDYDGRPFPAEQLPFHQVMDTGQSVTNVRHAIEWPDGRRTLLAINAAPLLNDAGEIDGVITAVDDVTEHIQADRQIQKLNRIYAVLSNINQAIVHVRETQSLLDRVCQVAVEIGGFRMAWIGRYDPATCVILPNAHAGETGDYLEKLRIAVQDPERGSGPTGRAVKAGEHVICNNIELDPRMEPWRADALRLGYCSSAAFPLIVSGQVQGTLNLYAGDIGFFDSAEIQLLDELAMNLSYAIESIEREAERQRAEKRAADLADIVENSQNEVYVFDASTLQFIWANRSAIANLGYNLDELRELTPHNLKVDLERDSFIALLRPLISGERRAISFQSQHRRKNGSLYPVDVHLQPSDYEGRRAIVALILDTSERRQAEARVRLNQERLQMAQAIGQVGSWEYDLTTGRIWGSDEGFRIYGMVPPADNALPIDEIEACIPERERVHQALVDLLEQGKPYDLEFAINPADGSPQRVLTSVAELIRDDQGNPLRVAGVIQDVTVRRRAEQEQRASEERFQRAVEEAPFPIMIHAEDGEILTLSRTWTETTGYDVDEIPTIAEWTTRAYGAQREQAQAIIDETYEMVGPKAEGEFVVTCKNGSQRVWEFSSTPLGRLSDGRRAVISMAADVTERKAAEDELRRLNLELEARVAERTAELQARNRELETFTYSVSHDLKAPLRGIDGYSRLLLEDHARQLDEEGRAFVHTIRQATHQMNQLIEDLLAYSRLERRALQSAPVNLPALVEALRDERRDEVGARHVAVSISLECNPIEADPDGLTMVLRNLLDNALKFTRDVEWPVIEVGGRESESSCIVWVRDNGIGFDMQFHDRIFEIFQRLHRAEEYPGTGIGLAIVRKALERMGGRAWAKSAPGQGATFFIEIPRT